jgi:chromosome segregation ATPase
VSALQKEVATAADENKRLARDNDFLARAAQSALASLRPADLPVRPTHSAEDLAMALDATASNYVDRCKRAEKGLSRCGEAVGESSASADAVSSAVEAAAERLRKAEAELHAAREAVRELENNDQQARRFATEKQRHEDEKQRAHREIDSLRNAAR